MGKKRKSRAVQAEPDHLAVDSAESRKRIRTYEDVADSEDEFHLNQDKILLDEGPVSKRRRQLKEQEAFLEQSDEEVLDESKERSEDDDQETGDESEDNGEPSETEDEEGWGTSRADLYGTDAIETEEQALEEEIEARRLQKKQLQAMSAADFGFDEDEWANDAVGAQPKVITETLPELQIAADASDKDRLKLIRTRYPEFEPLSRELLTLDEVVKSSNVHPTKLSAASAYLGALTMYFALLTSTAASGGDVALAAQEIRDHEIMTLLVDCRNLWQQAAVLSYRQNDLDMARANGDSMSDASSVGTSVPLSDDETADVPEVKSRAQRHAEAVQAQKRARIAERLQRSEAENADLDELLNGITKSSRRRQHTTHDDDRSDIGEELPLTKAQAEEKARRKKSLRFYTSQIAQKTNKRGAAGRTAGGDDDVPHRERLRDRQVRLNAEAEKRGKRSAIGDDLDGGSIDGDAEEAQQIRQDQDDDYYDMVAVRTAKKKSDKKAYAEAQKRAEEFGGRVVEQETVGADGKRKVTYAIEKNKGLTPHRKKDVRNPRVKKRKKFEEKTKKLASMKPTFKGGEGRGGYGGELTGIKANLVKSTKL